MGTQIVAVEIVFGDETFEKMIVESANYLTEYGSSIYYIGFQYIRNTIDFNGIFLILKRREEINSEKRKALNEFYKKNKVAKYKVVLL